MARTVIIGGVAGGASCAARLRRLSEEAEIILLERGAHISYANCGLPYHVGGVIPSSRSLQLLSPETMRDRFHVDVRIQHEATAIHRDAKFLTVRGADGNSYELHYDTLVIATGSSPVRPPIPGIDSSRVVTLWTVEDAVHIREAAKANQTQRAVVVGGGFIGLEMAENLREAGLEVTLIEASNQVMPPLDYEMALPLHAHLAENGIQLHLSDSVTALKETDQGIDVMLKSGETVRAQLVVLSVGVRPNSALAKDAGLALNAHGGIVVNDFMCTSDPFIYAVGDVTEVNEWVMGKKAMIPLAGPANKQGRIAADNIAGGHEIYSGTQGTSIAKVFGFSAACTGVNEKTLIARGMVQGTDYQSVTIVQNHHAAYYPGAKPMLMKMLFSLNGSKIWGAQIVGHEGVDKRIDVLATVIRLGGGVSQLKMLELAYAPPYSSAKDPVNMLGYAADNVLRSLTVFAPWNVMELSPSALMLDIREPGEVAGFSLPNAVCIPLGQLQSRMNELPKDRDIVIFCGVGVRAHTAQRKLAQHGFTRTAIYPGGVTFYRLTHPGASKRS